MGLREPHPKGAAFFILYIHLDSKFYVYFMFNNLSK